jgi:hypothetical protein
LDHDLETESLKAGLHIFTASGENFVLFHSMAEAEKQVGTCGREKMGLTSPDS